MAALCILGCAREPEATTTLRPLEGDAIGALGEVTDEERREALQVMSEAVGPGASRLVRTAPETYRWSDVPAAASTACDEHEVALVRDLGDETEHRFELRTVDGRSGLMRVSRPERSGESLEEPQTALQTGTQIGRDDGAPRVEVSIGRAVRDHALESAIEESFHDALARYAKRRQLEDYR